MRDPDFEAWLDEQTKRERNLPHCGTCGTELLLPIKSQKPRREWWVCTEPTCGHAWEMVRKPKGLELVRKPDSDGLVCKDKECCS